jgi:putative transposase
MLKRRGERVGKKRVARLMRQMGIEGVSPRSVPTTTISGDSEAAAPDLVDRDFEADAPDELWVADITYVPTSVGFMYLAVVLDVYSRRIVGWSMASHLRTALVLDALNMALEQRRPDRVVHHSDQGTQYTSIAFGNRCQAEGVQPSMGSVGDCYDNAMCESFFSTLECELIDRTTFTTKAEAKREVFRYIEGWYNPHRIHSGLDYLSPINYEKRSPMHHAA